MRIILLLFVFAAFYSPFQGQTLTQIESVEYIPATAQFVVSNGTNIVVVENSGNPTGYFGTTASAQYGMEVLNNALVVINNNSIVAYDVFSGNALGSLTIPGVQFLNGMATDGVSFIYVTDFSAKKIYQIDCTDFANMSATVLVSNTSDTPNGICFDAANNRLVYVCWGTNAKIKAVDLTSNTTTVLVNGTGLSNMDGIDITPNGDFYCSSWSPARITRYNNDFSASSIVAVTGLNSPADICYANEVQTLAIPNGNEVVIMVSQPLTSVAERDDIVLSTGLWPNPTHGQFHLVIETALPQDLILDIVDVTGKIVQSVGRVSCVAGRNQRVVELNGLTQGCYWLKASTPKFSRSIPFVLQ